MFLVETVIFQYSGVLPGDQYMYEQSTEKAMPEYVSKYRPLNL
jgi:hypothetical protein